MMIDSGKIKKEFPKAYQLFSSHILKSAKVDLGEVGKDLIDIVLTSRGECLRFLDECNIFVIVQVQDFGGGVDWFTTIDGNITHSGCETREEAEVEGIYKAFSILEKL